MASGEPAAVVVAGRRLVLPQGMSAHLLSDNSAASKVEAFVTESPDHTVYHRAPYIEFAKRQNGAADVLLLSIEGQAQVAVPFHPSRGHLVTTGYSGVCLPPGASEPALRRAIRCLADFAQANPRMRLQSLQSAQAASVDDRRREGILSFVLDTLAVRRQPLHTRLCRLHEARSSGGLPSAWADDGAPERLLRSYDGDLRNQIRQASRRDVTARVMVPRTSAEAAEVYAAYLPIHEASWRRTGLRPHSLEYLLGLDSAVRAGGGHEVIVFALSAAGVAVAAVTCHVYGDRAIYWSGCSLVEALALRANPLCLHSAIIATQRLGARTFELGRFNAREPDPKETSVTRYKAQFGGDIQAVLNFEFGAPRIDAREIGRTVRRRVRRWTRMRVSTSTSKD